jgi:hypothetical protein
MADAHDDAMSRALRRAARHDEPRALDGARAEEMVARALAAARQSESGREEMPSLPVDRSMSRRAAVAAVALCAAAALAIAWPRGGAVETGADIAVAPPARMVLSTGDALVASPGAEYRVDAERRRVELDRGELLCDVRPLGGGARFALSTPHARIEVLGTVFSVRVEDGRSDVWVYEGRVRVTAGDEVRELGAGESIAAGEDPLAVHGRQAAAARAQAEPAARAEAEPPPTTEPGVGRRRAARRSRGAPGTTIAATGDPPAATADPIDATADPLPASAGVEPTPAAARALLAEGRAAEALRIADAEIARGGGAEWWVLRADALRALGRAAEAVATLEEAATRHPDRRETIGYRIASVRWRDLRDGAGALDALERHGVTRAGAPIAERGLALAIDALEGRDEERRRAAIADYVARFPSTPRARALRDRNP